MFKINDRVDHVKFGPGTVTGHLNNLIKVKFILVGPNLLVNPEELTRVENNA